MTAQIHTASHEEDQIKIINQYEKDLTGNGLNEIIELKGVLLSEEEDYYHDIWAVISSEHHTWKIPYLGGYDPKLEFIPFSNEKEIGVFYHSKQSDNKHDEKAFLHTINNQQLQEVKLPKSFAMSGSFQNHFTVHFSIDEELDPIRLQIREQQQYKPFYTNNGLLHESIAVLTKKQSSLEPTYISAQEQYGLKNVQQVYNEDTNETLGAIATLWYYEYDRWVKLKEQWIAK